MISFYTQKTHGQANLTIRIRRKGTDIKVPTGIYVDVEKWRKHKEKATTMACISRLQKELESKLSGLSEISSSTVHSLLTSYFKEESHRHQLRSAMAPVRMTLNRFISQYLSEIKDGRRFSIKEKPFMPSSVKSVSWAMKVFADYQANRSRELDFDDIDLRFLDDYRLYMEKVREFKVNTISKCIKELKTIMGLAKFQRYTDNTYFSDKRYGVARRDVVSIALNEDELFRFAIVDTSGMGGKAQLAKDLFLAGVCTCQRHSDFCQIGSDNLEKIVVDRVVFRPEWDQKWDQKEKPAENQRVTSGAGKKKSKRLRRRPKTTAPRRTTTRSTHEFMERYTTTTDENRVFKEFYLDAGGICYNVRSNESVREDKVSVLGTVAGITLIGLVPILFINNNADSGDCE